MNRERVYYRGGVGGVFEPSGQPLRGGRFEWGTINNAAEMLARTLLAHYLRTIQQPNAVRLAGSLSASFTRNVVTLFPLAWEMDARVFEEFRHMYLRGSLGRPVDWRLWGFSVLERGLIRNDEQPAGVV